MRDYSKIAMCALDFVRALNERPWVLKVLCRLFFGRYAYREFTLIVENLHLEGLDPLSDYGCEGCSYHDEPQPLAWWQPLCPVCKDAFADTHDGRNHHLDDLVCAQCWAETYDDE